MKLSKDAVHRHALHTTALLAKSPEKAEIAEDVLRAKFIRTTEALINDLERLRRKAEASRDIRGAARIIDSSFRGLELLAKFWHVLDERPKQASLHVHLSPDQALAIAETYAARHRVRVLEAGESESMPGQLLDTLPQEGEE